MNSKKIYIAGHLGMVGSSLHRLLKEDSKNILITKSHKELDLTDQKNVLKFFKYEKPDEVYLAAAKVGGILANSKYPADFLYENIMIQANIIKSAFEVGVKKLLFLGSSCIYPKDCIQPIAEKSILTGPLEPTNEPYAIAKITGIKLCESLNRQFGLDFRSVMPCNLFGPGDNYHPENSHVIPSLIRKFHEAKVNSLGEVIVWGTGRPRREFLYVDDMVRASVFVMNLDKKIYEKFTEPMCSHINIGSGLDYSIKEISEIIKEIVNFKGNIKFDKNKPDGTYRKLLDIKKINDLGWRPSISLREGLIKTYSEYLSKL